jgi:4'-phosphopantetheinyl transferase EntD
MTELFDARVALRIEPIGTPDLSALPPEEQALVAKAVAKRQREFAAGRHLARAMLQARSLPDGPLLRDERGAVGWPPGVQASISHSGPWVGVAMTTDPSITGVGLDIEDAKPLGEKYWHVILTDDDMCHLETWPQEARETVAKRMFGAKEAAYKAQYPSSQEYLPFSAMWIAVGPGMDTFVATFRCDAGPWRVGDTLCGRFAPHHEHVVTAVVAERRP